MKKIHSDAGTTVNTPPAYHIYSSRSIGWPLDPNGALYWKGRYHLMWIQSPGPGWADAKRRRSRLPRLWTTISINGSWFQVRRAMNPAIR